MRATEATDGQVAFLAGMIDYAGLFPPAELPLAEAVAAYREVRRGPERWLADRFVVPASKLAELAAAREAGARRSASPADRTSRPADPAAGEAIAAEPWSLAVTVKAGGDAAGWLAAVREALVGVAAFARRDGAFARPALAELSMPTEVAPGERARAAGAVAATAAKLGLGIPTFVELPFDRSWPEVLPGALDALAAGGGGLKLRLGGSAPEATPGPADVAAAIDACRRRGMALKATAGLHHPFRDGARHGFVNVIGAAVLAHARALPVERVADVVEDDRGAFALDAEGLRWRDQRAGPEEIAAARRELFVSFGSCSVAEPVEDLLACGWLPAPEAAARMTCPDRRRRPPGRQPRGGGT